MTARASLDALLSPVLLSMALLLSACSSEPVQPDRYYRIELPPVEAPMVEHFARVIVVVPTEVNGLLAERALLYRSGDDPSLQRYPAQLWAEPPALMFAQLLVDRLRAQLGTDQVFGTADRIRPDLLVRSHLRRLESVADAAGGAEAQLALDFVVSDQNGPLLQESVSLRAPVTPAEVSRFPAVVATMTAEAYDRVARRIALEVPAVGVVQP